MATALSTAIWAMQLGSANAPQPSLASFEGSGEPSTKYLEEPLTNTPQTKSPTHLQSD